MLLISDVESLICERTIGKGTQDQYRRAIKCYSNFLTEPAKRTHLKELQVNRWLMSLDGQKAPETIRGRKAGITAVWNWLAETGQVKHYNPNRLRRIRVPEKIPIAWSVENVRALLAGAATVKGTLRCGVKASDMLTAWIWLGYEAGIRPGDILQLSADQIGKRVHIVQHKTRKQHSFELSDHALAALRPLIALGRRSVFGLPRSTARRWELRLFQAAKEFGFQRRTGQGLGTLRKTHGTEVCRRSGIDAAALSLGHVSGTLVARRSYVQPDAIRTPPPPPSLKNVEPTDPGGTIETTSSGDPRKGAGG
jgi:integrase